MVVRLSNHYYTQMSKEKSQLDKFKEAARQLETDEDEERFEKKLKKLVKQKPKDDNKSE